MNKETAKDVLEEVKRNNTKLSQRIYPRSSCLVFPMTMFLVLMCTRVFALMLENYEYILRSETEKPVSTSKEPLQTGGGALVSVLEKYATAGRIA